MKINLILLTFCLFGIFLWTSLSNNQSPPNVDGDYLFASAKNFEYVTINGRKGELIDEKGNVVLLHFWATWCAPCLEEFPDLIKLARNNPKKLKILGVSSDLSEADIDKFLKKLDLNLPDNFALIWDEKQKITKTLYGTKKLPESFLISPSLKIREKITGPQENWASETWNRKIQTLHN